MPTARGRGVASADTLLAASVGEASGRLAEALERVHELRTRHAQVWVSFVVLLLYPAVLVFIGDGITQFQNYYIISRFEAILSDFGIATPWILEL